MTQYQGISLEGKGITVTVSGSKIKSVVESKPKKNAPLIAVPLVDTQNNGAIGYGYNRCYKHLEKIKDMVAFYRSHGVGRMLMTTTTCDANDLIKSGKALSKFYEKNPDIEYFYPGVFHEGIFMSKKDGWRGAHPLKWVKDPDYKLFKKINSAFDNRIKKVNIAPEEPNGLQFVEKAAKDGLVVSIGHACPTSEEIKESVKRGATMVTHFGNGACPTIHRHKNPFWGFLAHDELKLGLILDGHHLPWDLIQTAIKAKGRDNINVVSDCSSLAGKPPGDYGEDRSTVTIREDGYLHMKGQEILAGAWFQIDRCVELLCQNGWTLAEAWRQCSIVPAKNFKIPMHTIKAGQPANFVVSNYSKGKGLVLEKILHNGQELPPLPIRPTF